ncbi:unnamed protein product, partial [Prorocentrum cordatum]
MLAGPFGLFGRRFVGAQETRAPEDSLIRFGDDRIYHAAAAAEGQLGPPPLGQPQGSAACRVWRIVAGCREIAEDEAIALHETGVSHGRWREGWRRRRGGHRALWRSQRDAQEYAHEASPPRLVSASPAHSSHLQWRRVRRVKLRGQGRQARGAQAGLRRHLAAYAHWSKDRGISRDIELALSHHGHALVGLAVALEPGAEQPGPRWRGTGIDGAKLNLPACCEHFKQLLQQLPDASLHLRPNDHAEALDDAARAAAAQVSPRELMEPMPPRSSWTSAASRDPCQLRRYHQRRARRTQSKSRHMLMWALFAAWDHAPKCEPWRSRRTDQDSINIREATKVVDAMPPLLEMLRSFQGLLDTVAKAIDEHFLLDHEVEDLFGDIFEDAQFTPDASGAMAGTSHAVSVGPPNAFECREGAEVAYGMYGDAAEGPVEYDLTVDEDALAEVSLDAAALRG